MRVSPAGCVGVSMVLAMTWLAAPDLEAATSVRPLEGTSRTLLKHGVTRSPTIRWLVERLEASDVIVYLELRRDMASGIVGSTRFMARTTSHRVLRVSLNRDYPWPVLIAFLGHELQHAREIADAPEIASSLDLQAHYQRAGVRMDRHAYDSHEAREIGRRVDAELRGERARQVEPRAEGLLSRGADEQMSSTDSAHH